MNEVSFAVLSKWEQRIVQRLKRKDCADASHDFSHFQRVWHTAGQIIKGENQQVNKLVVMAACYLHDIIVLPKNHPQRASASTLAAKEAERLLRELSFPDDLVLDVSHAVQAHSYSAQIIPRTIEAKIVQDADRMEALGAIGIARVFYTAGLLKQALFDPEDPLAENRPLNDRRYALDHFQLKLFKIADTMQTKTAQLLAQQNVSYLRNFMMKLCCELKGDYT